MACICVRPSIHLILTIHAMHIYDVKPAEAKGLLPDLLNVMGPARWLQVRACVYTHVCNAGRPLNGLGWM